MNVLLLVNVNVLVSGVNILLDHEKLDVYKASIEFMVIALNIADKIPRGYSAPADKLKRASWSIPLNIAEGCGKTGVNGKRRFYAIARGSVMECSAVIDVCQVLDIDDVNSPDVEISTICACGDEGGATFYATRNRKENKKSAPIVIEFQSSIQDLFIDGLLPDSVGRFCTLNRIV